jgi:hypothetical protein
LPIPNFLEAMSFSAPPMSRDIEFGGRPEKKSCRASPSAQVEFLVD